MDKSGIWGPNKGRYGKIRAIKGKYSQIRVIKPKYSQIYVNMIFWGQIRVDKTKLEQIITLPNLTFGQLFM